MEVTNPIVSETTTVEIGDLVNSDSNNHSTRLTDNVTSIVTKRKFTILTFLCVVALIGLVVVITPTVMTSSPAAANDTPTAPDGSSYLMGTDISDPLSQQTASCLSQAQYEFIIIRGYKYTPEPDSSVCPSLKAAHLGGLTKTDVYLFPNPKSTTKNAAAQVKDLIDHLNKNCKKDLPRRIWIDIEVASGGGSWNYGGKDADFQANKAFYQSLVDTCKTEAAKNSMSCGVYSYGGAWATIFGKKDYSYGSELPLWWTQHPKQPNFNDYTGAAKFGGWTTPYAKQYITTDKDDAAVYPGKLCNMNVDYNWMPKW